MRLLLDTHCWLWWLTQPERLGDRARALLADAANEVEVSVASAWEIAIKYSLGKLPLPVPPEEYVPSRLEACGFGSLPVRQEHALRVAALPFHHRDPFDRLLVAQAQLEGLAIVTADPKLGQYEADIIPAR